MVSLTNDLAKNSPSATDRMLSSKKTKSGRDLPAAQHMLSLSEPGVRVIEEIFLIQKY